MVERDNTEYNFIAVPLTHAQNSELLRQAQEVGQSPMEFARTIFTVDMAQWEEEQNGTISGVQEE